MKHIWRSYVKKIELFNNLLYVLYINNGKI